MGVFKKTNEYMKSIDASFYEGCPKSVFAALAVSYIANYVGIPLEDVTKELHKEWGLLNSQGIVPQKPTHINV